MEMGSPRAVPSEPMLLSPAPVTLSTWVCGASTACHCRTGLLSGAVSTGCMLDPVQTLSKCTVSLLLAITNPSGKPLLVLFC